MDTLENKVVVTLERMTPVEGLPDLVFTANAGVVVDGVAVPSRFRHPERQREESHFEEWFEAHGYQLKRLKKGTYFEGAGDLLGVPDLWLGGYRKRSDIAAYSELSKLFQREIIPVELVDDRFYHLDTCFCPLSGGEVLYYPQAFDQYAQAVIADRLDAGRRIPVPEKDAHRFACNAVCVGKKVVLPAGCPETVEMLHNHGYEALPLELDEFMKAGGSAKCLTLRLDN
jgi:N-dimethylarginine dimethylaminohydrolase